MRMKPLVAMLLTATTMSTLALAGCDDVSSLPTCDSTVIRSITAKYKRVPSVGYYNNGAFLGQCYNYIEILEDICTKDHFLAVINKTAEFIPGATYVVSSGQLDCSVGCSRTSQGGPYTFSTPSNYGNQIYAPKSKQETLRGEAKAKEDEAAKLDRQERVAKELAEIIRECK